MRMMLLLIIAKRPGLGGKVIFLVGVVRIHFVQSLRGRALAMRVAADG
jgi:hypothetical protein